MRVPGTDLDVSPISLGTAGLGTELRGDHAMRLLDAYASAGGNFLDSAHVYACWVPGGEGASERTVGAWLRSRGQRAVVSTKGGHPPIDGYPHRPDFLSPESIAQDVAESLDRLGRDQIDLYYLHRDDGVTPVDEIVDALNDRPELRWFGASNWSLERVTAANAYAAGTGKRRFVALQNQWSLAVPAWSATSDPTVRYVTDEDAARLDGLLVHAYSATANGYFTRDDDEGPFRGNAARRGRARDLAGRLGKTPTQIALAWLLSAPSAVVPLVGTTKVGRLHEALGAVGLEIDPAMRAWLRG